MVASVGVLFLLRVSCLAVGVFFLVNFAVGTLLVDAIRNFFDGIVIAASFLSVPTLGVSSALAVVEHEVPQEVGDLGILLHGGYGKGRAFAYNLLSSDTTPVAAIIAYFALPTIQPLVPYVLAIQPQASSISP